VEDNPGVAHMVDRVAVHRACITYPREEDSMTKLVRKVTTRHSNIAVLPGEFDRGQTLVPEIQVSDRDIAA